nr:MAG TPA: hypothetical protein [Caudoviricetes sp.]
MLLTDLVTLTQLVLLIWNQIIIKIYKEIAKAISLFFFTFNGTYM